MLSRKPLGRLRTKIIAWSFVPTTIILFAVALTTFYAYQKVTEDLVIGRNQELTRLSAGQLAADLTQYTDLLATEARNPDIYQGDALAQQGALSNARNRLVVFDAGVVILDSHGKLVAAEPERPENLAQDWSNRAYFRQMIRSGSPVFSDVVADGPRGAEVIVVAVPITGNQREFKGTMAGMFRLGTTAVSAFYGGIVKLRIGESGSTSLVDANGRIIYHSDSSLVGENVAQQEVVKQVLARKTGHLQTRDLEGRNAIASFAPVPGTSWGLINQENWTALMSSSQAYGQFLLLLLVLGVVVPVVVVTVGVKRITGPIEKLISASQDVAAGNFDRTISVSTGDELEEMAKQFNLMSAQLRESYANLERKVADRTRELATLNAIAAVVSGSLDLDEILNDALDKTMQAMDIRAGGIYILDERSQELTILAQRGLSPEFVAAINHLRLGEGFSGFVAQSGQPLTVRDVSSDPRLSRAPVLGVGPHALAAVPLSSHGRVLGTLFANTDGLREFSSQDVQLLTSIGHQIGVAIENAHLFAAEQRRAEQFRVINEVGQRITSILDLEELLDAIVRLVSENLGYHMVAIGLVEGEELVFKAGAGAWWEVHGYPSLSLQPGAQGITAWVARNGEPLLVPDVSQDTRYYCLGDAVDTRSELAVPLKAKDAILGVLDVQSSQVNAFDESDVALLQLLTYQAAVAIENARLYGQAQQLAVMEERNRLARDLHDSVTQAVYSVTLYAEATARLLTAGRTEMAADHLRELRTTAQQALREMRSLIFELRPPVLEKEGLVAALQARLEAVEGRAGLATEFTVEGEVCLPAQVEEGLYRIAQEALNNVLKHSQARNVRLRLQRLEDRAILQISDDGAGFDSTSVQEHGGLGLKGMAERAEQLGARLNVHSRPGEGTIITVEVPCPQSTYAPVKQGVVAND